MSFTGDLPDWFYRIELPRILRSYFTFDGVSGPEFADYLQAHDRKVTEVERYLCLTVLPMGWSWAPFVANTLTLDTVGSALEEFGSQRLVDGLPTPLVGPGAPVHWAYMDDYGSLAATGPDHAGFDLVEAMGSAVRAKFIAMGVTPHKGTSLLGLSPSLGVEVTPDLNLQVISNRLKLLEHGTRHASRLPRITPRQLSSLLGSWVWCFSIFKEMLSVLSACYAFNASAPVDVPILIWESVRQELRALVALALLLRCPLDQEWSTDVLMLDASDTGFGVVMREAPLEDIRSEARFGEKKGWVVEVDRLYSET